MMRTILAAALIGASIIFPATSASATSFIVSYEAEAAGVQNTTATLSQGGVDTFDTLPVHAYPHDISAKFGDISGVYSGANGVQINAADQYGGAGGNSNYIVAFQNTPFSLTLSEGVNYFGFWLSALDKGNFVTFYGNDGKVLFTFNPQDVINAVNLSKNPSLYYGNPNSAFIGQDGSEPFVFLNFFDIGGTFSKIAFNEVNFGGGYESDNHTVGKYISMGQGTIIPLVSSITNVPEPATWVMMVIGFAFLGYTARRRRNRIAIA